MKININTPTYTDFEQAEDVLRDMELAFSPPNIFQYTDDLHDNTFATKIGMPGANRVLDRPQDLRPTPRWNMFRDTIEDLYIRQELKLSRVREIMEEHHKFYATEQMYKKKLRSWRLRKNLTQEEKIDAFARLEQAEQPASATHCLAINHKSVKLSRLKRPIYRNGDRFRLVARTAKLDMQRPKRKDIECPLQGFDRMISPSRVQLQQSQESHRTETVLFFAKLYYSQDKFRTQPETVFRSSNELNAAINTLSGALYWLGSQRVNAFAILNKACSSLSCVLPTLPFLLILKLLAVFRQPGWRGNEQAKLAILNFIKSLSTKKFGPQHPLTIIFSIITVSGDVKISPMPLLELSLDIAKTLLMRNAEHYFYLRISMLESALDSKEDLDAIAAKSEQFLKEASTLYPSMHTILLESVILKARLCSLRGEYATTEIAYLHALDLAGRACGASNVGKRIIWACRGLACVYAATRRFQESEQFHRKAIKGAQLGEKPSYYIFGFLTELEAILAAQGKEDEIVQLRHDYEEYYQEMESWALKPEAQETW